MIEPLDGVTRYALFTSDGKRFVWGSPDSGIAVEEDSIAVMRAGRWTHAAFADIVSVTLNTAMIGRSSVAQCIVVLGNGNKIVTSNANANGFVDGSRNRDFEDFVVALHRQLVASGAAKSIAFHSGYSSGRMNMLMLALIAGVALFLVLPLGLLLVTGDIKALGIIVAGCFLLWPAWQVANANKPSSYSPERPPNLFA